MNAMIKPDQVARYLRDHPQFFEEHPDLLESIRLPHPYDGRAISINERQLVMLREKNSLLQDRLQELIDVGENNDAIGEKMHRLTVALLGFDTMAEMLHGLPYHLCEDFSIPHAALRLWQMDEPDFPILAPEFAPVSENLRMLARGMAHPYCGPAIDDEIRQWFGKDGECLKSFAIIPLKKPHHFGLLALGSPEPERFYPDMGTLYLERLGDLVSSSMMRLTAAYPAAMAAHEPAS